MEPVNTNTPPAPAPPPAAPIPGVPPPPAMPVNTPAPAPAPAPQYGDGGEVIKFNWLETGLMIIGVTAIFFIIHYYNQKSKQIKEEKSTVSELRTDMESVKHEFNGLKQRFAQPRRY